jgi:ADP-ribose pyrophosphatase YjhB (NUDIX family)
VAFSYSRGSGIHDAHPVQRHAADFGTLVAALDADRAPTKAGAGYICGPLNGDGRRCAEGALPRRWLALDFDRIDADALLELRLWFAGRFSGCAWPTHSSRPDAPRERVLIELDRDATRAQCIAIGRTLANELAQEFGRAVELDESTFKSEQPVFVPPAGVTLARFFGEPLDVEAFVTAAPAAATSAARVDPDTGEIGGAVQPGGRHAHLVKWAAQMNWRGIAPEAIALAVRAENLRACSPPKSDAEVAAIVADITRRYAGQHGRDLAPQQEGQRQTAALTEQADAAPPVDIFRQLVAPPLVSEDFPAVLADFVVPHARAAGHDASGYLLAGLVAAAGMIDDRVRLRVDTRTQWFESARLWGALLGPPGSAKTPAIRAVMGTHFDVQRELRQAHDREFTDLPKGEKAPPPPMVFSNDATVEALSDILVVNPRGVLTVCEELDSWLGSHDAYRGGQGSKDRGEWLRLFDGGPHQVDRVKRGSIFVPNWGVSLLGATTPAGLRRHAKDLPPDGLIQRFLVALVRPATEPDHGVSVAQVRDARERFELRMRELYGLPGGFVDIAPAARTLMEDRHAAMRRETNAATGLSDPFAGHLAKHPGLLARVALTMHCIQHGAQATLQPLGAETMAAGSRLLRRLGQHALVMFDTLADRGGALPVARAVGATVVALGLDALTRRDLIHRCRAYRDASEGEQEAALRLLVDAAWLTPVDDGRLYRGRPAQYAVHSQVRVLFAAQGQALRARRMAVRELLGQ